MEEAGVIYLSETLTFTTLAWDDAPTDNLAALANGAEIIGYSSAFSDAAPDERFDLTDTTGSNTGVVDIGVYGE